MAKIISISLSKQDIEVLDKLQQELELKGRSETLRNGLHLLASENHKLSKLSGVIDATLIVIHPENNSSITRITHEHEKIIKTHIHSHLKSHKCLEVFILRSNARSIRKIVQDFQKSKKFDLVKLIVR